MADYAYFEDPLDLCDFLRSLGSGMQASKGYDLYRISHPKRPAATAYLLGGVKMPRRSTAIPVTKISAEVDKETATWQDGRGKKAKEVCVQVLSHQHAKSMLELIELQPWERGEELEQRSLTKHVIFWLGDTELLPELVKASLKLGNDRIQYGQIQLDGEETCLLRIEKPSYFLIQQCLEEFAARVTLYCPIEEDLYLQWGYHHPLQDVWSQSERKRELGWLFFQKDGDRETLEPIRWIDAYDLTEFHLDFPHTETWTQSSDTPLRFQVPLRLQATTAAQTEPELWLLSEAGHSQLERVLQLIDEEQVRPYQLAVQQAETLQEDLLFVREKRAGDKRKHMEFLGCAFGHHQGLQNFFLPTGYELLPPLRRDLYRHLFELEPNVLTVLVPEAEGHFRIVKVRERSFQPLTTLLDYIVEREAEVLEDRLEESVFDFQEYLKAPSHGLAKPKEEKEQNRKSTASNLDDELELNATPTEEPDKPSIDDLLRDAEGAMNDEVLEGLSRQERDLERSLVEEQTLESWGQLLACKSQLQKRDEAITAAVDALWLCDNAKTQADLERVLNIQLTDRRDRVPEITEITGEEPDIVLRAGLFQHLQSCPDKDSSPREIDIWLSETSAYLTQHSGRLRVKERWLAWGQLLRLNQDERREAQLREEIVSQIGEHGMGPEETPSFIRTRIFLDRNRAGDADDADGQPAVEQAVSNLMGLSQASRQLENDLLQATFDALLARSFAQIGSVSQALQMVEQWSPLKSANDVWAILFHAHAMESVATDRAEALQAQLETMLEKTTPEVRKAVEEHQEMHQRRSEIDSPAAFLAQENRSRSYPSGGNQNDGVLQEMREDLRKYMVEGDEIRAVQTAKEMLTLTETEHYDDHVKLPQTVEVLVQAIAAYKWGDRGAALIPLFERFAHRAPGFISQESPFYLSLLHANLANGFFFSEDSEGAKRELGKASMALAHDWVTELDFIDGAAAVLGGIEQLPLAGRREPLASLFRHFTDKFDASQSHFLQTGRLFVVVVRLMDQYVQAAVSKDRLSLNQFKNYQLQDEFLILQRIQRETFCVNS